MKLIFFTERASVQVNLGYFDRRFQVPSAALGSMNKGVGLNGLGQHRNEHLQRRAKRRRGVRPVVEAVGNRVEFVLTVSRHTDALGQVRAQQPVGILASSALARALRIAEVAPHAAVGGQLAVTAHLAALVIGEALAQGYGDLVELDGEARQRRGGSGVLHPGQHHQDAPLRVAQIWLGAVAQNCNCISADMS
jgi:hypothetical protein